MARRRKTRRNNSKTSMSHVRKHKHQRQHQRQGGVQVKSCSTAHLTKKKHLSRCRERHNFRSQHVDAHVHTRQGFEWSAQSCWMDSSLMAMFYPDPMYNVLYDQFAQSNTKFNHIREVLVSIVKELREANGHPSLHSLRSILADETPMIGDQKYAFQREHELGYVFYFLQEIQKLFGVQCMRATPPYGATPRKLYVLEMERCGSAGQDTVQTCLNRTYSRWSFEDMADVRHMFIELIDEDRYTVQPQEEVQFQGYQWQLCSMIVFDCSHFVTYLKQNGGWWLYDDTRALSHMTLKPHTFGQQYYTKGSCRYQYGVQNTFFFYVRK
jgi:hypothetical protein